jgi:integrase
LKPLAKKSGHVAPQGHAFRLAFDKVRKDAGLLAEWEGNEMRHSFGSYHMAMHKDPGATTAELGHTSPHLVFRHYRKLVSPEAAAIFWSISPESAANVIAMDAKSA